MLLAHLLGLKKAITGAHDQRLHRPGWAQARALREPGQVSRALSRRPAVESLALPSHLARRWPVNAGHEAQQAGLAAAVGSTNHHTLTLRDAELIHRDAPGLLDAQEVEGHGGGSEDVAVGCVVWPLTPDSARPSAGTRSST